jgi:hypothetical protein
VDVVKYDGGSVGGEILAGLGPEIVLPFDQRQHEIECGVVSSSGRLALDEILDLVGKSVAGYAYREPCRRRPAMRAGQVDQWCRPQHLSRPPAARRPLQHCSLAVRAHQFMRAALETAGQKPNQLPL